MKNTESDYRHFLSYSGLSDSPLLKYAYYHGANADCKKPLTEQRELNTRATSDEVVERAKDEFIEAYRDWNYTALASDNYGEKVIAMEAAWNQFQQLYSAAMQSGGIMTTLSDMTDNDLLLEVARMKYPGAEIERKYRPDMTTRAIAIHADGEMIFWYPEANTIHPLWAEYAERYLDLRYKYYDAYRASLTLRGMLEAVWTVLKEGK